jgi:hypothetical protein
MAMDRLAEPRSNHGYAAYMMRSLVERNQRIILYIVHHRSHMNIAIVATMKSTTHRRGH